MEGDVSEPLVPMCSDALTFPVRSVTAATKEGHTDRVRQHSHPQPMDGWATDVTERRRCHRV